MLENYQSKWYKWNKKISLNSEIKFVETIKKLSDKYTQHMYGI